jgi:hypothetical protein
MKTLVQLTDRMLTSNAGLILIAPYLRNPEFRSALSRASRIKKSSGCISDVDIVCSFNRHARSREVRLPGHRGISRRQGFQTSSRCSNGSVHRDAPTTTRNAPRRGGRCVARFQPYDHCHRVRAGQAVSKR